MNSNTTDFSYYLIKLVQENDRNYSGSIGLMNGRLGICFLYYLYSFSANNKDSAAFHRKGHRLFNTVCKQVESLNIDITFSEGIEGLGWFVEWLVQNKLVKTNPDKFLEDIDDTVFQIAANINMDDISLNTGIAGHLFYFINRFRGINRFSNRYKIMHIEDTLIMLSDELIERISSRMRSYNSVSSKMAGKKLMDLKLLKNVSVGLYGLVQLWQNNLNTSNIQGALSEFIRVIEEHIFSYLQKGTPKDDERNIILNILNILVYINRSFTKNETSFELLENSFENNLDSWTKDGSEMH